MSLAKTKSLGMFASPESPHITLALIIADSTSELADNGKLKYKG
jgi:hypothetical protein